MPTSKRRTKGGRPVHDGRVTRRDVTLPIPRPPARDPVDALIEAGRDAPTRSPASSSRYTPPPSPFRFRPSWHKVLGFALLVAGVALAVVNDVMMLQPSITLLPGGHNELYLFLGIAVAAYSTWWFGWFDRQR
jgi:hypothetical protein